MDVRTTSLTGAAGEHLVMSRLLSRGYIAALAPQGVLNFDIVVTSTDGRQLCAFQVKSSWAKGADRGWHMHEKHESIFADTIFYALVDLGATPSDAPRVYVVPSKEVADAVRDSHHKWYSTPGKNGRVRKETSMRRLNLDYTSIAGSDFRLQPGWLDQYEENWGQIAAVVSSTIPSAENGPA